MAHFRTLDRLARMGQTLARQSTISRTIGQQSQHPRVTSIYSTQQVRTRFNPANPGLAFPKEGIEETEDEFDQRWENYFNKQDIDGWEVRKGINDMQNYDLIPEPKIMVAVLKACRRINDHSLAVRYIEAVWRKAEYKKDIVDYLSREIRPTLNELGISTPEEMGYDEPELALGNPEHASLIEKPVI